MKTIGNKTLIEMLPQIKKVARKHNLKTYKAKDFKKIMKLLGVLLLMVSCNSKKNRILDDSITTIKDMKEWMIQDQQNEIIDYDYAEYYIEYLDKVENDLIKLQ
jgi:hypothetical protein